MSIAVAIRLRVPSVTSPEYPLRLGGLRQLGMSKPSSGRSYKTKLPFRTWQYVLQFLVLLILRKLSQVPVEIDARMQWRDKPSCGRGGRSPVLPPRFLLGLDFGLDVLNSFHQNLVNTDEFVNT